MRVEIIREDVTYLAEEVGQFALAHPILGEVVLRAAEAYPYADDTSEELDPQEMYSQTQETYS